MLTACNESDVDDVEHDETSTEPMEEDSDETESSDQSDVALQSEPSETMNAEPIEYSQELWHSGDEETYEVSGTVGPIIRDGDLAILPVSMDTEDDVTTLFTNLFDQGLSTGEGIASRQGLDIQLIDSERMAVSRPGAFSTENDLTDALHTFIGKVVEEHNRVLVEIKNQPVIIVCLKLLKMIMFM
ncbi:hypothetical protein JCM19055_1517 [Geomicrobium sp. JCM 19055]|nr:hypothetical protein JCM19055_1517 [Geomicrobium sp. JCM 19055]